MKRIWIVDDQIPIWVLYKGPVPSRIESHIVEHLADQANADHWEEKPVLELCRSLCAAEYDATFFLSPDAMLSALKSGAAPPHAVIFDWQYPGQTPAKNLTALGEVLATSFAYIQIYTHLGGDGVEPIVAELKSKFPERILPVKQKTTVTAGELSEHVKNAWKGTIAGEVADRVRAVVASAVEQSLIDMCEVKINAIADMVQGERENFIHIVLSKIRDHIGLNGGDALDAIITAGQGGDWTDQLRRLMSIWYYTFPTDNCVRCGDLVKIENEIGLVVTPPCDLFRFAKKTGSTLTWLRVIALDAAGMAKLKEAGLILKKCGSSIIANHDDAGQSLILLPSAPLAKGSRTVMADYAVLCHRWESKTFTGVPVGQQLKYESLPGIERICTLAEPLASAVVTRAVSVIASPGTPDLPKGEIARLKELFTPKPSQQAGANPA